MSRTNKDKPLVVQRYQYAQKHAHRIDHSNHLNLGQVEFRKVFAETVIFAKDEPVQLHDYKSFLDENGILYDEDVRTSCREVRNENGHVSISYTNPQRFWQEYDWMGYNTKEIEITAITPYKIHVWSDLTENCTEIHDLKVVRTLGREYYVDRNTGKEAVCTPDDLGGRNPKKYYLRPKYGKASRVESRTNVKQAAWKAAKTYNAGEMDEGYDDVHLNSYVLDVRGCYCCG